MTDTLLIDHKEITEYLDKVSDFKRSLKAVEDGLREGGNTLERNIIANLSGRILKRLTGTLVNSRFIDTPVTRGNEVTLNYGSRGVPYGAIHEFGGIIKAQRVPFLRFQIEGKWVSVKQVTIPERRPFRQSAEESADRIAGSIALHLIKEYKDA